MLLSPRVQSDKRKPSRRQTSEHQNHIDLRICILEDYRINVLSRNVYKMYKLRKLQCPHGLQETDFMDLLRSNFPQLAAQETFDFFLTDKTKRLQPLRAEALTPEEIYRSIGLSGSGNSALYIRLKAQEELQTSEKELHHAVKVSSSTSDLSRLNTTSSRSQHKDLETDKAEDEDGGRSESAVSRLWSLMVLSESAAEGGELSDDDWKPDKREKHVRESEPEKTTRKRRVKQMKQSSTKASTDNGNASLSCKVCGALRGTGNMLIKHAWSHVDDPEWLCGVCGKHSESEEQLRSHLQSHQKTHSCNICGKSFLSINGLNGHVARHKGKKPYSCKVCHKTFAQSWVLKNHMWVHVSDKPNKCDFCQKSFTSKIDLRRHRLKHTDERLHRCNLCGKSLRCLDALSKHKQSHAVRETTFACQICSKTFKTHQKCQVHMKVHAGEKPYKCPVCYMAFRFKHSMKRHIKTHREGSDLRRTEAPVQVLANRLNGTKSVVKRGR
ncbi:zinc finger protein 93-like [Dicentrarchus labrax]|uniref:zinc finger protein 93-like n=1 Tax=Dicentrarchus labrax TaxID=13489 RepID=UPI0021F63FA9|nr:zinc finger protein 93-like [Dicentrarchus labrax]